MGGKRTLRSIGRSAILGCGLSAVYFLFLGVLIIGNMLGDCFPELGHHCPTNHERNVRILVIIIIGVAFYGTVGMAVERYFRTRFKP